MTPSLSTSLAGLCGALRGVGRPLLGGEELAREEAGYGGMELTDRKRPRLSKLPLPTLLSISSARCSVFSFSSCINLKQNKTVTCLCQKTEERVWITNLGLYSVLWLTTQHWVASDHSRLIFLIYTKFWWGLGGNSHCIMRHLKFTAFLQYLKFTTFPVVTAKQHTCLSIFSTGNRELWYNQKSNSQSNLEFLNTSL